MSGICGVWALDGGAPDLAPVIAKLERRGPDGTHGWTEGPVALGHTLLATTPEALVEVQPLTEPDSGSTITADARLDNRDELIAALELGGVTRTIGDGELILRSYLKWGEECPTHLLGDFGFAIWDPRAERLFCARDQMGMRQFNYCHLPGKLFAFSTEAEALVAHADVPKRINEARIADFLDDLEGIDFTSTFFEGVFRLPPAHFLTVNSSGLKLGRYWQLTPGPELKLDSDQAYADAFLAVFTEAVRCRLRSAGPVGSMLSGGMDSGSVVAIASRLLAADGRRPLHTFSAVGPDCGECVETRAILSATSLPGLSPTFVAKAAAANNEPEMAEFPEGTEPFDSHMTLIRAVYRAAVRAGVRVILDGVSGDVILTSGNRVAQLLRKGRLIDAAREAQGEERFWGKTWPGWKVYCKSAWAAFVPSTIRDWRHAMIARRHNAKNRSASLIASSFAEQVDLPERREQHRRRVGSARLPVAEHRALSILHPNLVVARERYDRLASAMGIEPRDPFMDRRVVEFCLSLPSVQLQANGWPKLILRRAMRGLLPDEVIWRRGKEHLGWEFTQALFDRIPDWRQQISVGRESLSRYVATSFLSGSNHRSLKALDTETQMKLFYLLNWIGRT